MSADIEAMKKRRNIMLAMNAVAALAAVAAIVIYFHYGLVLAGVAFVAALLMGFGAQIWFIAGLRGPAKRI